MKKKDQVKLATLPIINKYTSSAVNGILLPHLSHVGIIPHFIAIKPHRLFETVFNMCVCVCVRVCVCVCVCGGVCRGGGV